MREILFKAKRLDNLEWVEGYYLKKVDPFFGTEKCFILNQGDMQSLFGWNPVNPETVCRYTGLADKNGVKIFENDVINVKTSAYSFESVYVEWNQEDSAWCFRCANMNRFRMLDAFSYEVVGNIHDDA